ncbi:MAG TPA: YIP1 family protein [Gammaproteobacteria bacterium]|jgi:hypothetical protein
MNASASNPTALGSLLNIFLEPRKTFEDLRQHNGWLWFPLVLALGALMVTFMFYYGTADWDVIRQQQADVLSNYHMTRDQIDQALNHMTRTGLVLQTSIFLVIFLVIIYLIQALYLFLAAKVTGSEVQGFGSWFSFTCWAYFPSFLGSIATLAAFLVYGKQATMMSIDVTSLNTLIFKVPMDNPWFTMLSNLHLALFWSFALMVIGFSAWTKSSLAKSAAITLAPHALIYGVWIVLKLI